MKNLTIITLQEDNIEDFSAVRNRELAKVKTDWVLFLDSDETMSKELESEVMSAISSNKYSAYRLRRLDTFLGRELHHGENGSNRFVRLARRDWGEWQRPVHEVWQGRGRIGDLTNPIIHKLGTISQMLNKLNHYSTLEAAYRFREGKRSSLFRIAIYPPAKFVYNYVLSLGFLDGTPGTIMAVMMSLHSFLTWTKLYLLQHKP